MDAVLLYVTVSGTDELVIIDTEEKIIQERIPTESFPFWIAVPGNR